MTETPIYLSKILLSTCERHGLTLRNTDSKEHPYFVLNMSSAEELIHGIASAFKEIQELDNWVHQDDNKDTKENSTQDDNKDTKEDSAPKQTPMERLYTHSQSESRSRRSDQNQTEPQVPLSFVVQDFLLLSSLLEDKTVQELFRNTSLLSQLMPSQPGTGRNGRKD